MKKLINNLWRFGAALVVGISSLAVINFGTALAAGPYTCTWTGGGSDGNFSTAGNWSGCNSSSPQAADNDILIFNNASLGSHGITDDVTGLNVASIEFQNNASGQGANIVIGSGKNLTVNSAITQDSTDTNTSNSIASTTANATLTLGGNVTVSTSSGLTLGDEGDTLALGGHTLNFVETAGSSGGRIVDISANMTGSSATVVYNGPNTEFQLYGTNTYSGTTTVTAGDLLEGSPSTNGFGTSAISVATAGSITFFATANRTISNAITVAGTTDNSFVTSLDFSTTSNSPITYTVSGIVLSGNTRFANDEGSNGLMTINLAGITANGHCLEYLGGSNDGTAAGSDFQNGPAACIVTSAASTPKAPNTGLARIAANPLVPIGSAILAAGAIALVAKKTSKRTY